MFSRNRRLVFSIATALFLCPALPAAAQEVIPGELLVGVRPEQDTEAARSRIAAAAGRIVRRQERLHVYGVLVHPQIPVQAAVARLQALGEVEYVEPNRVARALAIPNDPSYSKQWALKKVQAEVAWPLWQPQSPVVLAVVDTGVAVTHSDLTNKILRDSAGIVGYNALTGQRSSAADDHGHGTHCAGIAAAQSNNGVGVAGISGWNGSAGSSDFTNTRIMPVKVLDSSGSGSDYTVADGIVWAADHGAKVISLSLGGGGTTTLQNAVDYAWGKGCVVVAAAGNSASAAPMYPAAYPNAIAVAATDSTDTLASFSNYGDWVDVAAPGVSIYSTYLNNGYATMSGTSMATPLAAGEAAFLWAQNPGLTNADIRRLIETNVDPYKPYGGVRFLASGAGRINLYRAQAALNGSISQPPPSGLTLTPSPVVGSLPVTAQITLASPAGASGAVVVMTSSDSCASAPNLVAVPAGASAVSVTISTLQVSAARSVTITASSGGATRSASLTVNPLQLSSISLSPASVVGGRSVTGKATLNAPATGAGIVVTLASSSGLAAVPASVKIPAGQTSATFAITTSAVTANASVTISGTYVVKKSATLTITTLLKSVALSPATVTGGKSSAVYVYLYAAAPEGGVVVSLSSSSATVTVPATLTIPAGATQRYVTASTSPVASNVSATITATLDVSRSATLTVIPPVMYSLTLSPSTVTGGAGSTGTVTLTGIAPSGGVTVALSSADPAVAAVPASVVVPAGAKTATFAISTSRVSASTSVVLSATAGATKTAVLTISP